jgi:hypothetical protein
VSYLLVYLACGAIKGPIYKLSLRPRVNVRTLIRGSQVVETDAIKRGTCHSSHPPPGPGHGPGQSPAILAPLPVCRPTIGSVSRKSGARETPASLSFLRDELLTAPSQHLKRKTRWSTKCHDLACLYLVVYLVEIPIERTSRQVFCYIVFPVISA